MLSRRFPSTAIKMLSCAALGFCGALMLAGAPLPQQPETRVSIPLESVPASIKAAVEAHAPGAALNHAWKDTENDSLFYFVRAKAKDSDKVEFKTNESGRIVEVMHDFPPDKLPADVVEQVKKLVPNGIITMGDRHMAIRWKITVKDGDKTKEVLLRADGKHAVTDAPAAPASTPAKPSGK